MKKHDGESWMPAPVYGKSLTGMGINLLVRDVEAAIAFATHVLEAEVVYSDPDFAVLRAHGVEWMLHADHTYLDHPLYGSLAEVTVRGIGIELRLHQTDPDGAEKRARERGYTVLAGAMDKPHGLREAYIVDPDGYVWVPDMPLTESD